VSLTEEDYVAELAVCRHLDKGLFVWVLDALDLPGSIFRPLVDATALQRQQGRTDRLQVVLALNKMDLFPANQKVRHTAATRMHEKPTPTDV